MSVSVAIFVALIAYVLGALPVSRLFLGASGQALPRACCERMLSFAKAVLDIAKGFLIVLLLCVAFGHETALIAATAAFLGHIYPVFRDVSGGYGMGVLLGALVAFDPTIGLVALVTWTFGHYVFRFAGLAALSSAIATPLIVSVYGLSTKENTLVLFALSIFIFWRQREHLAYFIGQSEQVVSGER